MAVRTNSSAVSICCGILIPGYYPQSEVRMTAPHPQSRTADWSRVL